MLITTTQPLEGKNIKEYKNIVFGEKLELRSGFTIIGTKIDVTPLGDSSYLVVTARGTAVVAE